MEYHKINTIYKRDMSSRKGRLIVGDWSQEEFEYLKDLDWEWTEKIDGTNIRVELTSSEETQARILTFKGRTDKATIPQALQEKLSQLFPLEMLLGEFPDKEGENAADITLYGEGYGKNIQTGGNYISNDVDFILFDIRVGNWWLTREACEDIATKFNLKIVPIVGYGSLAQACELVKHGYPSLIAENRNYQAEGLILKPKVHLKDRAGRRIITKIKHCDFKDVGTTDN